MKYFILHVLAHLVTGELFSITWSQAREEDLSVHPTTGMAVKGFDPGLCICSNVGNVDLGSCSCIVCICPSPSPDEQAIVEPLGEQLLRCRGSGRLLCRSGHLRQDSRI